MARRLRGVAGQGKAVGDNPSLYRSDEAGLVRHNDELRPVPGVQLGKQATDVGLGGGEADRGLLSPAWSGVVLVGYAVVALGAAVWLISLRDA
jgi:hypothetical protein